MKLHIEVFVKLRYYEMRYVYMMKKKRLDNMPIKIMSDLPSREILERENVFVMDEGRAEHQDIRPIRIGILNLMPLKEETELQLLRSLANTPLQVDVTFLTVSSHESKNTSMSHLNHFYQTMDEIWDENLDGLIITGAPVETMEYEEVDYWKEVCDIMEWSKTHVTSTPCIYAGAHRLPSIITMVSQNICWMRKCLEFSNIR